MEYNIQKYSVLFYTGIGKNPNNKQNEMPARVRAERPVLRGHEKQKSARRSGARVGVRAKDANTCAARPNIAEIFRRQFRHLSHAGWAGGGVGAKRTARRILGLVLDKTREKGLTSAITPAEFAEKSLRNWRKYNETCSF